eukprot:CAMPEP_0116942654 /NCGR_PEP_ID=MMETSP0467-20121206/34721_1 /TAXON_ID=283647 /ORGANISM="Mesodinium pulex, Strain SPMC105" /LENGTH=52 /DNA_ID=CAMNT_0004625687 /DNA_START=1121 /DNA_END=1279 /DNA_ORIENTATION=-
MSPQLEYPSAQNAFNLSKGDAIVDSFEEGFKIEVYVWAGPSGGVVFKSFNLS